MAALFIACTFAAYIIHRVIVRPILRACGVTI